MRLSNILCQESMKSVATAQGPMRNLSVHQLIIQTVSAASSRDETWCFVHNFQGKQQSSTWKLPLSPRRLYHQHCSKENKILEMFLQWHDTMPRVYSEVIMINEERYVRDSYISNHR
jgi:hypothetical protein